MEERRARARRGLIPSLVGGKIEILLRGEDFAPHESRSMGHSRSFCPSTGAFSVIAPLAAEQDERGIGFARRRPPEQEETARSAPHRRERDEELPGGRRPQRLPRPLLRRLQQPVRTRFRRAPFLLSSFVVACLAVTISRAEFLLLLRVKCAATNSLKISGVEHLRVLLDLMQSGKLEPEVAFLNASLVRYTI